MEQIENLKKLIDEAKKENDEILVRYLTQALNHIIEKENIKLKSQENTNQEQNEIREEKKEVFIEEKHEDKEEEKKKENDDNIVSKQEGEVSTIYKYSNGQVSLKSAYTNLSSEAKNQQLRTELNSLLTTMATDDATKSDKSMYKIQEIADKYISFQDMIDIQSFLSSTATIGTVGKNVKNEYTSILKGEKTEYSNNSIVSSFNNTYDKLCKDIDLLDMNADEMRNKSSVDSNAFDEIIESYKRKLAEAEKLHDEVAKKINSSKEEQLVEVINYLKETIQYYENYIKQIQDIAKNAENSLDSLNI